MFLQCDAEWIANSFFAIDADGSGYLERDEFENLCKNMHEGCKKKMFQIFEFKISILKSSERFELQI